MYFRLAAECFDVMFLVLLFLYPATSHTPVPAQPTPTVDRLAIPVLPDNPTPFDLGLNVYYYNCMPCHGDNGQGLTEEWMSAWEEDHQNCWGRGCHGNNENYTFFIPTVVPALVGIAQEAPYISEESLFQYLRQTHPPQKPGKLSDEEYRNVSIYLLQLNDFDRNTEGIGGYANLIGTLTNLPTAAFVMAASIGILLTSGTAFWLEKRER